MDKDYCKNCELYVPLSEQEKWGLSIDGHCHVVPQSKGVKEGYYCDLHRRRGGFELRVFDLVLRVTWRKRHQRVGSQGVRQRKRDSENGDVRFWDEQ